MEVEKFRGYVTTIVAAVLAVGSVAMAAWAWNQPINPDSPKDLAVLFGVIGTAFGAASGWLFGQESAARASHAAERSFSSGTYAGQSLPQQAQNGHVLTSLEPIAAAQFEPEPEAAPEPGIDPA